VSRQLFATLNAPLLRAGFRHRSGRWRLHRVRALSVADVAPDQREALRHAAAQFVTGHAHPRGAAAEGPAIAILHTPSEPLPPSNPAALGKFVRAAQALGMRAEIIDRHAIGRLPQFDALFIRDTTYLEHYTSARW
jgi:hypothetical protein